MVKIPTDYYEGTGRCDDYVDDVNALAAAADDGM